MLVDTHAHLDDEQFDTDRGEVLSRARGAGVTAIVNASYHLPSAAAAAALAADHDWIYAACGIHPHEAGGARPGYQDTLRELAARPKVVAIGEIGLDYYRDLSPREEQRRIFREQLSLARELELPVIIHSRDAHGDVLRILKGDGVGPAGGVMHCFSGSWEMAREVLAMGFYISLAGPVTFSNATRLAEVARRLPCDRLLVETDCPYLAPVPYRGRRNEPAYVRLVAQKVAELRGVPFEELAAQTAENAARVFRLPGGGHA